MSRLVTVICDDETHVHLPGVMSDYATLCGLDGDDPAEGLFTLETKHGAKVDCDQCKAIFNLCKTFRSSVFK